MGYFTTVKTVNKEGQAIKAEVVCGGKSRGFTDANSGELSFELVSNDTFSISARRSGEKATGKIRGGQMITLRLI